MSRLASTSRRTRAGSCSATCRAPAPSHRRARSASSSSRAWRNVSTAPGNGLDPAVAKLGLSSTRPAHSSCRDGSLSGQLVDGRGGFVEEPGFRVLLTEAGDRKMEAVRVIRTVTGLSLWNSKILLADAPVEIEAAGWFEAAVEVAWALEDAGARTRLLCDCCRRPVRRGAFPLASAQRTESRPLEICWANGLPTTI
ncbi:ribosomal protein L7/L12 [Streptomyces vinaceus]|uniref:ribosomal protein L7/L12 n=1 Tax=Streptomyces vinaceus TaxID=1960 RepID=UPI0035DF9F08